MALWRSPHDSHSAFHLGKKDALVGAICLSVTAFALQLLGSWYTGSLALLGDSMHLLTDLFSLIMSLAAVILAGRPTSQGRSFGFYRLEVLASFVNGLLLLFVSLGLAKESLLRLWHPEPVKVAPLILVALIGLIFNLLSAWLLLKAGKEMGDELQSHHHDHHHHKHHEHEHGHSHEHERNEAEAIHLHSDRNLHSALLHVWSDAAGSVAVIAGALVMEFTAMHWVDAAVSLVLVFWIFRWAWKVILDSGHVLLESTPRHVHVDELIRGLVSLDQKVQAVEDLHVWELTSRMYAATAEIRVKTMTLDEAEKLRERMHTWMHDNYGIAHVVLAIRPA